MMKLSVVIIWILRERLKLKLEFKNIEKSFREKQVLKGVSFEVESGKAFGLLGRNGAGKTTSIRILMDVLHSDSGEILIDGKPIDYKKTKFGYLPEERGLYPKKTILEQLIYFSTLKGMSKKEATIAIDNWLEKLEMTEYRNKKLSTLSKGNQQKIQLITALVHNPDIVILDEPFSGLDPVNAILLKNIVKEEADKGKVVLFSSHQMSYIEEFCDNLAILNNGKVSISGNLRDIKRSYTRDKLVVQSNDKEEILKEFKEKSKDLGENGLMLYLTSPESKKEVMKTLAEKYDIDEIKVFEPSLNDIFVEHTAEVNNK